MARFVSRKNPVSVASLKRKPLGSVAVRHGGREDTKFVRVVGGWLRSRTDVSSERTSVVSSVTVADECNHAFGCQDSWAKVY